MKVREPDDGHSRSISITDAFLEEYKSLREESSQARQAQQGVLQWSLATFGVLFAAGLVFAGQTFPGPAFAQHSIIYGMALPGLVVAASLVWWGEVLRMERVGYYLRGREIASWNDSTRYEEKDASTIAQESLLWETFIAFLGPSPGRRKQVGGYVGVLRLSF